LEALLAPDILEGEVRGFRQWTETTNHKLTNQQIQEQVWTFQVERYEGGKHLPSIPVELRGQTISGVLNEGHIVRLDHDSWQEGQTVRTDRVFNVTLNAPVHTIGFSIIPQIIVSIFVVLIVVGFMVGFYVLVNMFF
jgi:hypothetical protein